MNPKLKTGRTSKKLSKDFERLDKEGQECAEALRKCLLPMTNVLGSNPPPWSGVARPTWELVIEDMRSRDNTGKLKYGVRHQHDNGRNHLQDAYEEALDLAVYLRAQIEKERSSL